MAAAVAAVALVGLAAASGNPVSTQPYVPGRIRRDGEPDLEPLPPGVPPPPDDDIPAWLGWILEGFVWLCVVAIAATLIVLTIRLFVGRNSGLIRRRVLEPEEVAALTAPLTEIDMLGRGRDLSDAVAEGMAALAQGTDVRAGIITSWLRLEETVAGAGTPRLDNDAPSDLVGRVLAAHDVRPRRLQALAELYRLARFSPAPLDERDRDEARRALADVQQDLAYGSVAAGALMAGLPGAGRSGGAPNGAGSGPAQHPGDRWPTRWT